MEIGRTGETLGGFGLSGWAVLPIFVELAGKVVLGRENTRQMELPGGGEYAPRDENPSEPGPPTRVYYINFFRFED